MKATFIFSQKWWLHLLVVTVFVVFGAEDFAEAQPDGTIESSTAVVATPMFEKSKRMSKVPPLTEAQRARMEWCIENTHLPGPPLKKGVGAGPLPSRTKSHLSKTLSPGDPVIYKSKDFGSSIPGGYKSNVMESSVGTAGKYVFFTGNWFAARSKNGGDTWSYISSYAGFPDFCCDQIAIYDESRNIFLWLRMGVPDWVGSNYENVFKLSVSKDAFGSSYWTYTLKPTGTNSGWTNQWWDYPHIQLGADYVYISWNMFDQSDSWTRTIMLRWPLDALAAATGFSYNYYSQSDWFTFVPVQGAYHTMYFASNWENSPYNRLRIYRWDEDSSSLAWWTKTVTAWTPTGKGDAHCCTPNWLGRTDMRLLTGARYSNYSDGITEDRQRGRKVVAWWWNVGEDGGFTYPYIDAAAFYEKDMTQLPGWLGRPYVWSSDYCFGYPSTTPNKRQDLGMVFNYSELSSCHPDVAYSIADDYIHAPPGWTFYSVQQSNAGPSDQKWGDYNTVREFEPTQKVWVAGAHYIPGKTDCTNCSAPIYFVFGRERDTESFTRWQEPRSASAFLPSIYYLLDEK